MVRKKTLCLILSALFASGLHAETEGPDTAESVAAYRAEIVAALRARLAAAGTPASTRLIESPSGDDRVLVGADKHRIITATIGADGVATTCHEGVEEAAQAVAAARGDRHD